MLEGLEISILKFKEVKFENIYTRIDDEYFSKKQVIMDSKIRAFGYEQLSELCEKITDFGAYSQMNIVEFLDNGILFLRNQDVKENQISTTGNVFISEEIYNQLH